MSFKLAVQPFFWAPVNIKLVGDMHEPITGTFKAKFRRLDQDEYLELLEGRWVAPAPATPAAAPEAVSEQPDAPRKRNVDKALVDRILLDWAEMLDENDRPLPFTPDNLERVEKLLGVRAAVVNAFFDAHTKVHEKNSVPLPATTTGT